MTGPQSGAKGGNGYGRKLRLPAIGMMALAETVLFVALAVPQWTLCAAAQETAAAGAQPTFDAVSVKPGSCPRKPVQFQPGGRIVAPSVPARILIGIAYGIPFSAWREGMIGAPDWVDSHCFSIEAHAQGNPSQEQMVLMMRSFFADRFKLAVHWETRQLPVYALIAAKPGKLGPQLVPHAADNSTCLDSKAQSLPREQARVTPRVLVPCGGYLISPGHIVLEATLADFATGISWYQQIDRAVVDRTGLSGSFEITLDYSPSPLTAQPDSDTNADPSLPMTIFTALQEQLGLKLESQKGPVHILVIDHVEEPSAN
jgi:bla regulator protein blaR1